jgi:hypothetical protein
MPAHMPSSGSRSLSLLRRGDTESLSRRLRRVLGLSHAPPPARYVDGLQSHCARSYQTTRRSGGRGWLGLTVSCWAKLVGGLSSLPLVTRWTAYVSARETLGASSQLFSESSRLPRCRPFPNNNSLSPFFFRMESTPLCLDALITSGKFVLEQLARSDHCLPSR